MGKLYSDDENWKSSPCWNWPGWKNQDGYGCVQRDGHQVFAHRLSYETFNGLLPQDICVLHRCDNPYTA